MKKTAAGKGKHVGPIHNQEIYTYCVFYKDRDSLLKVITKIRNYYELKDLRLILWRVKWELILSTQVMMGQAFKACSSVWQRSWLAGSHS